MKDKIIPITFANNNMVKDNTLNGSMMYSFTEEILSEASLYSMINLTDYSMSVDLSRDRDNVNVKILTNYACMNITDIFISTIFKFSEEFFGNNPKFSINLYTDLLNSIRVKLRTLIIDAITYRCFPIHDETEIDYNKFISNMNTGSLAIFTYLHSVIDNLIENNCVLYLNEFSKNEFYSYIYKICYGKEPEEDTSDQAKYVFCSSILREASEEYLKYLNNGIQNIMYNVLCMRLYYIKFARNGYNPCDDGVEDTIIENYKKFIDLKI